MYNNIFIFLYIFKNSYYNIIIWRKQRRRRRIGVGTRAGLGDEIQGGEGKYINITT